MSAFPVGQVGSEGELLVCTTFICLLKNFLKKIYSFLERGEEERGIDLSMWLPHARPILGTWDLARKPGMCPRWGMELDTLWFAASAQPTEPHQPGLSLF